MMRRPQLGFTLVEMIIVIIITGIVGGIVAVFIRMPVQGYVDGARRATMTDIADTALRRMSREIRTALPNSVRIAGGGTIIEFLPMKGSGRYRYGVVNVGDDKLDFSAADASFDTLGPMPAMATGDELVIYNRGTTGADAYAGDNTAAYSSNTATTVTVNPAKLYPYQSPGNRFQVINTPVTYVCVPVVGGTGGTLTRYWGYAIQAGQPVDVGAAPLNAASSALLAGNVSACNFSYDAVGQRLSLVTLQLTLADSGEGVTLYSSTHISNVP
jgi:MSHA biogenesis protein MshO